MLDSADFISFSFVIALLPTLFENMARWSLKETTPTQIKELEDDRVWSQLGPVGSARLELCYQHMLPPGCTMHLTVGPMSAWKLTLLSIQPCGDLVFCRQDCF